MLCFAGGARSSVIALGDGLGLRPSSERERSESTLPLVLGVDVVGESWSLEGKGDCPVAATGSTSWSSMFWRAS